MAGEIPSAELTAECPACHRDMPLVEYGRVYQCGCGERKYRYPKPVTLAQAIDNMHAGKPLYTPQEP